MKIKRGSLSTIIIQRCENDVSEGDAEAEVEEEKRSEAESTNIELTLCETNANIVCKHCDTNIEQTLCETNTNIETLCPSNSFLVFCFSMNLNVSGKA